MFTAVLDHPDVEADIFIILYLYVEEYVSKGYVIQVFKGVPGLSLYQIQFLRVSGGDA